MKRLTAKITLLYIIIGLAWIFISDLAIASLSIQPQLLTVLQIIKGTLFTLITAGVASYFIYKYLNTLHGSQKALEEKDGFYRSLFEHNSDLICSLDLKGRVTNVNPATIRLAGYSKSEIINSNFIRYLTEDSKTIAMNLFRKSYRGGAESTEIGITHKLGHRIDFVIKSSPIIIDDMIAGVYIVGKDITVWKQAQQQINHMATHDELTGLPNRTYFKQLLKNCIYNAKRNNVMAALLLIDIDRFRTINDALGHENGDHLLKAIGQRLARNKQEDHLLSRIGGDEYTILIPNLSHLSNAESACLNIIDLFKEPFDFEGYEAHLTPSIGVAIYPIDGDNVEKLVAHADTAMYRAKAHGTNQFVMYSDISDDFTSSNLALENDMRKAIERDEFVLHYQPIFSFETGDIIAVEALLRWNHPELGLLPPMEFIPLAEDTGLIVSIGEWALETACKQAKSWHDAGLANVSVSVNLSARQLNYEGMLDALVTILDKTKLDPLYLELEITESLAMHDVDKMFVQMKAFTDIGIKLSIDDFGTGYSSLSYLKQFPINSLKIDRAFVREISDNPDDSNIVAAIIAMAHSLNLNVIAEGVENSEQMRKLHELGCNKIQGYLLSKPLPASEVTKLFNKDYSSLFSA